MRSSASFADASVEGTAPPSSSKRKCRAVLRRGLASWVSDIVTVAVDFSAMRQKVAHPNRRRYETPTTWFEAGQDFGR